MKDNDEKLKIIEVLRETPFISYAVKKIGVSRSTIYRWMESDQEFKEQINKATTEGHGRISDLAEMNLIKKIETGNLGAIKYYLSHNNRRYLPRRSYTEPVKELAPGETCESCGLQHPALLSTQEVEWFLQDVGDAMGFELKKKIKKPQDSIPS